MDFYQDKNYLYSFENRHEFNILYKEIFKDQIYKKEFKYTPKLIIDIGGHIGLTTLYFRKNFPNSKIIVYEPNPYSFQILQDNIAINNIQNVELNEFAITNSTGNRELFIDINNLWYSTSSLSEKGWNGKQSLESISVKTVSFESILDLKPDLIKMDIEGAEYSLIKNNLQKLSYVKYLMIEFHKSEDVDINKMLKLLTKAGFISNIVEDKLDKGLMMIYSSNKK